ncbi:MAG: aminodeoxychorismate/anthranilate synthase component II [Pseudomonadota bacterium]
MILVLDAYDSFVETLARYLREAGRETHVERADARSAEGFLALRPEAVVLSPGPRRPAEAGAMVELVRRAPAVLPVFGVCLGHLAIAEAFGGRTVRAPEPMHGRASDATHDGDALFAGVPSPFRAGRYHALAAEPPGDGSLVPIAWGGAGEVMALRHRSRPVVGVQFHPESILTPDGRRILSNFLGRVDERRAA